MKIRYFLFLLAAAVGMGAASAQELTWSVDFSSTFDNREGDSANDQTIFFTRLAPEVGVVLPDGAGRISGGVVWNQPVNNDWDDYQVIPTLYYRVERDGWRFNFGMFSRRYLMEEAPKFLWSDSIDYRQPNVRGLLVQHVGERGWAELMLDWRQIQTNTKREAFNVVVNSLWHPVASSPIYVGERLQYNHLAKQRHAPAEQGVNDDFMANPFVGVTTTALPLDSLGVRIGGVLSLQRCRSDQRGWRTRGGALVEANAHWRFLSLNETLYIGGNLMPLYPEFGAQLNMGSPYYQATTYSRTDVRAHIIRNRYVDLTAGLNLHITPDVCALWQQITLRVYIGSRGSSI